MQSEVRVGSQTRPTWGGSRGRKRNYFIRLRGFQSADVKSGYRSRPSAR